MVRDVIDYITTVKCFSVMSSSKLFIFSKEVHLNSGVRLLL